MVSAINTQFHGLGHRQSILGPLHARLQRISNDTSSEGLLLELFQKVPQGLCEYRIREDNGTRNSMTSAVIPNVAIDPELAISESSDKGPILLFVGNLDQACSQYGRADLFQELPACQIGGRRPRTYLLTS